MSLKRRLYRIANVFIFVTVIFAVIYWFERDLGYHICALGCWMIVLICLWWGYWKVEG